MGDSRLRGLYQEFVKQFQPSIPGTSDISKKPIHSDLNFADASLKLVVEFIWSPFASKRMTQHLMRWQVSIDVIFLLEVTVLEKNQHILKPIAGAPSAVLARKSRIALSEVLICKFQKVD